MYFLRRTARQYGEWVVHMGAAMLRDRLNRVLSGYFRAPRFPIQMCMRYRVPGENAWMEGETENISRSGVLFRPSAPLEVNTPLEVGLVLPEEAGGEAGALMLCQARVVRTLLPAASDAPPALAAKFLEYRIVRE